MTLICRKRLYSDKYLNWPITKKYVSQLLTYKCDDVRVGKQGS